MYLVWTESTVNCPSNILGVFADLTAARNFCQENEKQDIALERSEDERLEFQSYSNNERWYIRALGPSFDGCKKIWFMIIRESGEGGSYHDPVTIVICASLDDALVVAECYFDNEHNRPDASQPCPVCGDICDDGCVAGCPCLAQMVDELTTTGLTNIACLEVFSLDVKNETKN